jgi:hypothetical protein
MQRMLAYLDVLAASPKQKVVLTRPDGNPTVLPPAQYRQHRHRPRLTTHRQTSENPPSCTMTGHDDGLDYPAVWIPCGLDLDIDTRAGP